MAITKDIVESAYCFLHQKQRVYQYSTLDWQKDDIEYAIESYVDSMSPELQCHRIREAAVLETVDLVKNHPLVPKDVIVKGYIMDSDTGELTPIEKIKN